MAGSIRQEELLGSGCVAANVEKDATDAIWGVDHGLVDRAGLDGVLVGHPECIVGQFIVRIGSNLLIAYINSGAKAGKVDIDPIGVLRHLIEKAAVLDNVCIDWVLEAIGVAGTIECLILVRGEIDPEIPPAFGGVRAIAGLEAQNNQQ